MKTEFVISLRVSRIIRVLSYNVQYFSFLKRPCHAMPLKTHLLYLSSSLANLYFVIIYCHVRKGLFCQRNENDYIYHA